jgi:hypothetical protein
MKSRTIFGVFGLPDQALFLVLPLAKAHGLTPLIVLADRCAKTGLLQLKVRPPDSDPKSMCGILLRGIGCWQWGFCVELPLIGRFRSVNGGLGGSPASRLLRLEAPTIAQGAM